MNYSLTAGCVSSSFIEDEYLAMILLFGNFEGPGRHFEIAFGKSDVLEFATDPETGCVGELTLTACRDFSIVGGRMGLPTADDGVLHIEAPRFSESEKFNLDIFDDGLCFAFSCEEPATFVKHGQAVFGFTGEGDLARLWIADLTELQIAHVRSVLFEERENAGQVIEF